MRQIYIITSVSGKMYGRYYASSSDQAIRLLINECDGYCKLPKKLIAKVD